MYGLMLTSDTTGIENLYSKLLNMYFKPIIQHKRALGDNLIDRFSLRIRIPSLAIDLETSVKGWISRLINHIFQGLNKKTRQYSKDAMEAISKMKPDMAIRKHYKIRGGSKRNILSKAFKSWNREMVPAKNTSRVVDRVTKTDIDKDVLDSVYLTTEENCSAYRYIVYRFPGYTRTSRTEDTNVKLLMKQDLSRHERLESLRMLREVNWRDYIERKIADEAKAKAKLEKRNANKKAPEEAEAESALV